MSDAILPMKSERRSELPQCESIRGIAALLVFWFHYLGELYGYNANPDIPVGLGLFFGGSTGVTLFFVLSGFLLSRPFFMGRRLDIRQFFSHRALRILPMFYVSILIGALISAQWGSAIKAMFFWDIRLETLYPMGAVWWSLVIEVQFYLLLPVTVWLISRNGGRLLLIPALLGGAYIYLKILSAPPGDSWFGLRDSLLGHWPTFLLGAILAWGQAQLSRRHFAMPNGLGLPLLLCALIAIGLLCEHRVRNYSTVDAQIDWFNHHTLEAAGWTLFIFALLNFRFPGYRIFVNPWLGRLGLYSYSLYLLHSGVLFLALKLIPETIEKGWQVLVYGAAIMMAATAISALTYHLIERPFLRLKSTEKSRRHDHPPPDEEISSREATSTH